MKLVGKVKEAHGLKGDLYVLIFSGDTTWLPKLKKFGIGVLPPPGEQGSAAGVSKTLTCQRVKPFKKGLIIKAEELNDRNAAEAVESLGFYIPEDFLVSEEGKGIYLAEILNFKVKDPQQKVLGEITGFSSNGPQDLLVLKTTGGGTAEVPFVDAFIVKIDFKNRSVVMDLPEGLFELSNSAGDVPDDADDADADDGETKSGDED
jgi:16S rRNA processing protein RimM